MKNKFFFVCILLICVSCGTAIEKINSINSRVSFSNNELKIGSSNINSTDFDKEVFIDSIKNLLFQNKTVNLPIEYRDIVDDISFNKFSDTIYLADLKVKSLSGGMPLEYEYSVNPGDVIYFDIYNDSRNKLDKFQIFEGETSRFIFENLGKRDVISSSIKILSGNKVKFSISNDDLIKNLGLFKSKLRLNIKKTANVLLKSEVFYDSSFTIKKKMIENIPDTIYNLEANSKFKLGSKINMSLPNEISIPIKIKKDDKIISWSYWLGLNSKDTINPSIDVNPLVNFTKNELKSQNFTKNTFSELESVNSEIELFFENYTLDRRSLNFDKNYAMYKVDNSISDRLSHKGKITAINKSNLYDYDIHFVLISSSVNNLKTEIIKDIIDVRKYIKLTLTGI